MVEFGFNPVPKPSPGKRSKPKAGAKTRITSSVYSEVDRRSGKSCERCGKTGKGGAVMGYQHAHLESAGQGGSGSEPWNIAYVCGPSVNTGTCHHFLDSTLEGREWRRKKRLELLKYYTIGEGKEHWKIKN